MEEVSRKTISRSSESLIVSLGDRCQISLLRVAGSDEGKVFEALLRLGARVKAQMRSQDSPD